MTLEEAVLLLLAAAAVIALFLGLAQALEGRAPAGPRRRRQPALSDPGRPAVEPSGKEAPAPNPVVAVESSRTSTADSSSMAAASAPAAATTRIGPVMRVPADALHRGEHAPPGPDTMDGPAAEATAPGASVSAADVTLDATGNAPGVTAPATDAAQDVVAAPEAHPSIRAPLVSTDPDDAVAHCARLVLSGRPRDALDAVVPHLREPEFEARSSGSFAPVGLWTVAGLAHVECGEPASARTAFDAAGALASDRTARAWPTALAELAPAIARQLLEAAVRDPDHALSLGRLAAAWLRCPLPGASDGGVAGELLGVAAELIGQAHARATTELVERDDVAGACRYVQEAAETGEVSTAQAQALLDVVTVPLRREVDRLTAAAIRGAKDEARAVAGLGQAETLLGSIPDAPLPLPHRSAMTRRIWRAYTKLGFRRLGAGELDSAADALFRALTMKGVGRQRQVRDALVRTLEALGEQRVAAVTALLDQGDRTGAARVVAGVEAAIQRARAEGVPGDELEVATAKLRQLATRLESETAPH